MRVSPSSTHRPRLLVLGGCDVHQRRDLLAALRDEFSVSAAGSDRRLADQFRGDGIPFFHYPLKRGATPAADVRAAVSLYRICRRWRPDIVHAFATKPAVWGRLAARAAGVPVVVGTLPGLGSLYSSDHFHIRVMRVLYGQLQRLACHASDLTIFQNDSDAREFVAAGITPSNRADVIQGSGVRTDVFDPSGVSQADRKRFREELKIGPDVVLVTMVSRVIRSKGVLQFARAAARVRASHSAVRFVLVGANDTESPDRLNKEELEEVSRAVVWLGERQDIPTILGSSDIFVLPTSYREGIPRVLLEAASMGLPLIAASVAGCEDVVEPGRNGFLVSPRDVHELAARIERLVLDPDLRRQLGAASRKLAVEKFDLRRIARRTAELYWRLLRDARVRIEPAAARAQATLHR